MPRLPMTFKEALLSPCRRAILLIVISLSTLVFWNISDFSPVSAKKVGRHLTQEEIATVWIGVSSDELNLVRLFLGADGSGLGAVSFLDEEPSRFVISKWEYQPPDIVIAIRSPGVPKYGIHRLRGRVVGQSMTLIMSGEDWKREVSLRNEAVWERRWQALRDVMDGTH